MAIRTQCERCTDVVRQIRQYISTYSIPTLSARTGERTQPLRGSYRKAAVTCFHFPLCVLRISTSLSPEEYLMATRCESINYDIRYF
jgi:hypothetical protein